MQHCGKHKAIFILFKEQFRITEEKKISRTKTRRCKANKGTRREEKGDGEETKKAGNDINPLNAELNPICHLQA
jgi:hypothetical protein